MYCVPLVGNMNNARIQMFAFELFSDVLVYFLQLGYATEYISDILTLNVILFFFMYLLLLAIIIVNVKSI